MNTLTTRNTSGTPPAVFGPDLFTQFMAYIDRTKATERAYTNNLRQFAAWIRYKAITQPERPDIILYRNWLLSDHEAITLAPDTAEGWTHRTNKAGKPIRMKCKATTVKAYLQSVKAFFRWTASAGLYPDIAENIHPPKVSKAHKKDALQPADVVAIERSIRADTAEKVQAAGKMCKDTAGRIRRTVEQGKRLNAIYLLAVNAGLRTIEISRANVADLEYRGGKACLYIWGKGRSEPDQKKPIAPEVYAAIRDYLDSRTDDYTGTAPLFVSTGNRSGGRRIAPTTISTMLKRAMQAAGYDSDRLTAHSLRHTAAAAVMTMTGNNIYQTQHYLRHANPQTTEIYLDNDRTAQDADLADRLYRFYHGTGSDR